MTPVQAPTALTFEGQSQNVQTYALQPASAGTGEITAAAEPEMINIGPLGGQYVVSDSGAPIGDLTPIGDLSPVGDAYAAPISEGPVVTTLAIGEEDGGAIGGGAIFDSHSIIGGPASPQGSAMLAPAQAPLGYGSADGMAPATSDLGSIHSFSDPIDSTAAPMDLSPVAAPENVDLGSIHSFGTPLDAAPLDSYAAPLDSYAAPIDSYAAPLDGYAAPVEPAPMAASYASPVQSYASGIETGSSERAYGTMQPIYSPGDAGYAEFAKASTGTDLLNHTYVVVPKQKPELLAASTVTVEPISYESSGISLAEATSTPMPAATIADHTNAADAMGGAAPASGEGYLPVGDYESFLLTGGDITQIDTLPATSGTSGYASDTTSGYVSDTASYVPTMDASASTELSRTSSGAVLGGFEVFDAAPDLSALESFAPEFSGSIEDPDLMVTTLAVGEEDAGQ